MSRRTHKMIAAGDHRSTAKPTQANSLTAPCAKLFASCEDSVPATEITDIINSTDFITAALSCGGACTLTAGRDSSSIRVGSPPPDNAVDGDPATWADPSGDDWFYFLVAAPFDDVGGVESRAVYIEQKLTGNAIRCFPYLCSFRTTSIPVIDLSCADLNGNYTESSKQGFNCDNCAGFNLEKDKVYTIGAARRGEFMEHYVNGHLVGKVNVRDRAIELSRIDVYLDWLSFDGGDGMELTHSGWSGGGCETDEDVGHMRADWYGVAQYVFSGGLPSQASIEAGMDRMKLEWEAGNKIINPEWMTL